MILYTFVASALAPGNNLSELSLRNTEARIFPAVFRLVDFQFFSLAILEWIVVYKTKIFSNNFQTKLFCCSLGSITPKKFQGPTRPGNPGTCHTLIFKLLLTGKNQKFAVFGLKSSF